MNQHESVPAAVQVTPFAAAATAAGETGVVTLTAVSIGRTHLSGPALAGLAPPTLVVSAADARGVPVAGLPAQAFTVKVVASSGERRFAAWAMPIDTFSEVVPGVYALVTRESRPGTEPLVLLVSVTLPRGVAQGRVLVRVNGA
jgi:hypothetical protein